MFLTLIGLPELITIVFVATFFFYGLFTAIKKIIKHLKN